MFLQDLLSIQKMGSREQGDVTVVDLSKREQ